MKKTILTSLLFAFFIISLQGQNLEYANKVIDDLSSAKYNGRGYYKHGDSKAAAYIKKEFEKLELKNWGSFYQPFSFNVNTFHSKLDMTIDGNKLKPAYDFVVREYCASFKGEYNIYRIDTLKPVSQTLNEIALLDTASTFVAVEYLFYVSDSTLYQGLSNAHMRNYLFVFAPPLKRYMAASGKIRQSRVVWVTDDAIGKNPKKLYANVENEFIENYETRNVVAYIEGSQQPDSFYVFTAHLDHMGRFGKDVYYPGANDNISGVAMLLNLAEYYSKPENKPKYSMVFLAFAGEETGLLGSFYFTDNPCFDLTKIKYLINFDMIADNNKTVYIECSEQAMPGFEIMKKINDEKAYFDGFDPEELSGNSDHYPFAKKNVPAVFFLDHGDAFKVYHTPYDTLNSESLKLFPSFFKLTVDFVNRY